MKRPLTGLVVAYVLGILVGSRLDWPFLWCGGGVLALLLIFCFAGRSRWALAPLLAAVCCAGMGAYRFSVANASPIDIANLLQRRDQNIALRGVIVSDPGYREAEPTGDRHSFKLNLTAINRGGDWEPATGCVLIFLSDGRQQEPLRYGDAIESSAILRVPPPARNPGTFDWQRWLTRQNIFFTATIRKDDVCDVLAVGRGNPVLALSLGVREHFERALRLGLKDQPRLAGVLAGMVIGERADIPEDTYAEFQQTGVFHVFAISGLHVGVVTVVVVLLLRLVRIPRRWCAPLAIPLLIVYVFATGARPGAVRALVMAGVWLSSWMWVRPTDALSSLAAAALALLVWEPMQLFDGAFVLSFSVVVALVILAPRIEARLSRWVMTDPLLPAELVPQWRHRLNGPVRWLVRLLSCSLAAWLGLLPLMAVYFNLFTPVSILANVVVIPLVGLIIPVGMLSAAAYSVWPALTLTLNNANFFLLGAMIQAVDWLSHLRWGHWFVQAPPVWLTIAYCALLLGWVARPLKFRWLALPVALFLAVIAWPKNAVEITVLDLHDGAAVFVNVPGEQRDWLIDGGGNWSGERVVLPFLRGQGVDRLEAMMLTRGDKAHVAGLNAVMQHVPIRQAIHAGTGSRSQFFWEWLEAARRHQLEVVTLRAGEERVAGPLKMRVLNPLPGATANRSDDNALVLLLEYGATRVLLTSDIGQTVERQLIAGGGLRAQVLVKGRHGEEPSGTDEFLDAVQPEVVIQIVNPQPSDRYLEPDLRDRLRSRGTRFYRTDETGAVTIRLRDTGFEIRTCLDTPAPLGNEP